jgi:hypothetical protein
MASPRPLTATAAPGRRVGIRHLAAGLAYDTWPQGWHTTPGRRVGIHLAAGSAYDTWPQGWHTPGRRVGIRHPAQGWHTTPGPGLAYDTRPRVGIHLAAGLAYTPPESWLFFTLCKFVIPYTFRVCYSLYFAIVYIFIQTVRLYYTPRGGRRGRGPYGGGVKTSTNLLDLKYNKNRPLAGVWV